MTPAADDDVVVGVSAAGDAGELRVVHAAASLCAAVVAAGTAVADDAGAEHGSAASGAETTGVLDCGSLVPQKGGSCGTDCSSAVLSAACFDENAGDGLLGGVDLAPAFCMYHSSLSVRCLLSVLEVCN